MDECAPNDATPTGKPFKLRAQKVMLTWSHHIPKDHLYPVLLNIARRLCKGTDMPDIVIAHETSDNHNAYEHTHAVIGCSEVMNDQSKDACHTFCIKAPVAWMNNSQCGIHCRIDPIGGKGGRWKGSVKTQWIRSLKYLSKQDMAAKEAADAILEKLGESDSPPSVSDVCSMYKADEGTAFIGSGPMNEVMARSTLVSNGVFGSLAEQPDPKPIIPLIYEWQKMWADTGIEKLRDRRYIGWVYDPMGGNGKSDFIRHIDRRLGKDCYVLSLNGKSADILYMAGSAVVSGEWTGKVLLIDLARDQCDWSGLYAIVEQMKNGRWSAPKYKGITVDLKEPPSISIFSNDLPEMHKLTAERWIVAMIESWTSTEDNPGITQEYIDATTSCRSTPIGIERYDDVSDEARKAFFIPEGEQNPWKKRHNRLVFLAHSQVSRLKHEADARKMQAQYATAQRGANPADHAPVFSI